MRQQASVADQGTPRARKFRGKDDRCGCREAALRPPSASVKLLKQIIQASSNVDGQFCGAYAHPVRISVHEDASESLVRARESLTLSKI